MSLDKRKPYRNNAILRAAKGQECMMQSPFCNSDPDTVVFAHLNENFAGKALSQKADDIAGAFMCSACHDAYDGRIPVSDFYKEQEYFYLLRAVIKTIRKLLDDGVLK